MKKRLLSLVLMFVMVFAMAVPVQAEGTSTEWGPEDFEYANWEDEFTNVLEINIKKGVQFKINPYVITGFSTAGLAKLATNKDVVIPVTDKDGKVIEGIGNNAFQGAAIESLVIPNTPLVDYEYPGTGEIIKRGNFSIGASAFSGCTALKEVTFGEGVLYIGNNCFSKVPLTEVAFPHTLAQLNMQAFANANSIEKVTFADKHEMSLYIGNGVFNKNKIKYVKIPEGTNTIGMLAFSNNAGMNGSGLVHMYISEETVNKGETFYNVDMDKTRGAGMKLIVGNANDWAADSFTYEGGTITGLSVLGIGVVMDDTNVVIPETTTDGTAITAIGEGALKGYGLTSVTLNSTIETIGKEAFAGNNLTTVALPDSIQSVDADAFADNAATVTLTVTTDEAYNALKDSGFNGATLVNNTPSGDPGEGPDDEGKLPDDEDKKTEEDDKKADKDKKPTFKPTDSKDVPKTGDAASVMPLSVVMLAMAAVIAAVVLKRRSL